LRLPSFDDASVTDKLQEAGNNTIDCIEWNYPELWILPIRVERAFPLSRHALPSAIFPCRVCAANSQRISIGCAPKCDPYPNPLRSVEPRFAGRRRPRAPTCGAHAVRDLRSRRHRKKDAHTQANARKVQRRGKIERHSNIIQGRLIPTMIAAGVTGTPKLDDDGESMVTARYTGLHALRYFYAP